MIPLDSLGGNLLAWMMQVLVIASAASLLLVLLRIRHPRTQLAYCHAVLVLCLLLPLIEPWRHPVVTIPAAAPAEQPTAAREISPSAAPHKAVSPQSSVTAVAPPPATPAKTQIPWTRLALWTLAAGIAVKLTWMLAGLFRIRKFRIASMPLYPIPEPIRAAAALTHADALFCVSSEAHGPVMLGWLAPIVLLPDAFLTLGEEAQCGIACHELLHVRRHDWLVTMFEEIAGALLWFNPAVWMLLAQTRLAREQLVDEETVLLTSARESYIDALMAIARGRHMDLAPAPLFLRRRHLTQRMHLLLKEVSVSKLRLAFSYTSMTAVLAVAGWLSFTSFPLIGSPQFRTETAVAQATPASAQTPLSHKPAERSARAASAAPIPFDAHEPVIGNIKVPPTPSDRANLLSLLQRASQNSKLHMPGMPPWIFDVPFTTNAGTGRLGEIWLSGQRWRWTMQQGNYSLARIGSNNRTVEEKHVTGFPMQAQMLRNAIFWAVEGIPSNAQMRSAEILWQGKPATCLLTSAVTGPATQTQSRLWEEQEYCLDNASGLLQLYSIAPGTYFTYDYSGNQQFHGRAEPSRVAIYVAGALVVDSQFTITDAGNVDDRLLTPTPEMTANGPVITTKMPLRTSMEVPHASVKAIETVIVHAEIDSAGNVVEEELSAASDPALIQTALDVVRTMKLSPQAYSQWQEWVSVRFVPSAQ